MYNGFYKLRENPFRLTSDPAFFYVTEQHREALAALVHSICNHSGLTVLAGEAGTGKSLLLKVFQGWLGQGRFVVALITNPTLSREEFFDLLLMQLGIPCSSSLKSRQLLALEEGLAQYQAGGRRPVLIVDEAHRLSAEILEEIRLLLNLETPQEKLLEITLAGQQELTDTLNRPELRQLKQRISCYCRVEPLSLPQVDGYVRHRLTRAGCPEQTLFSPESIRLLYRYTQGIPRLINSLCDRALHIAFAGRMVQVTAATLGEAAADLDLTRNGEHTPLSDVSALAPGAYGNDEESLQFLSGLISQCR